MTSTASALSSNMRTSPPVERAVHSIGRLSDVVVGAGSRPCTTSVSASDPVSMTIGIRCPCWRSLAQHRAHRRPAAGHQGSPHRPRAARAQLFFSSPMVPTAMAVNSPSTASYSTRVSHRATSSSTIKIAISITSETYRAQAVPTSPAPRPWQANGRARGRAYMKGRGPASRPASPSLAGQAGSPKSSRVTYGPFRLHAR